MITSTPRTSRYLKKIVNIGIGVVVALLAIALPKGANAVTPAYVQQVNATPRSSTATVSVAYNASQTNAQKAGDTNVVAIGFGNTTSTISSVTDNKGNSYAVAAPLTRDTANSQAVYYAKNIAIGAGNTAVTVTFNTAVPYPDIRVVEYSGLDKNAPFDVTKSATGTGTSANSGNVTTGNASDLIFGAGITTNAFTAAGSGLTSRVITADGNIAEDKIVTTTGSYGATATLTSGKWIMQMVAFKADSGAPDNIPPTVPTNLSATAVSTSQINLGWTASTDNVGVVGYKIFRDGVQIATSTTTSYQNTGLASGTTYVYTVAAYDLLNNTSAQSSAASATTQTPDTTAPTVSLTAPADGATLTGAAAVSATASDNVGVAKVEFYIDGQLKNTDTTSPYGYTLDSTTLSDGSHTITAAAYDAAGNSATLAGVAVTVDNADHIAPSVPTNLIATPTSTSQINLSWNAATDAVGVTGYRVFRDGVEIASGPATSYIDASVAASTTYSYTVSAYDAAGNESAPSSAAIATTPAPDTGAPTIPSDVTATPISDTQINLSWAASTDDTAVIGYRIYRDGVQIATVNATSYSNTNLSALTSYAYAVSAYDAAGNDSGASDAVTATTLPTPDTTPPVLSNGTPTGTLPPNTTSATLGLATNEAASCRYATTAGTTYNAMTGIFTANGTNYSADISGLLSGHSYSYYARCQDTAGNANTTDFVISFAVGASGPLPLPQYQRTVIDSASVTDPWMKSVGDLNNDGLTDLFVSGHHSPAVWYEAPNWTKHVIATDSDSQSGSAIGDIDNDGQKDDVVIGTVWYKKVSADNNALWQANSLPNPSAGTHDIRLGDLNSDGRTDIIMRGEDAHTLFIFLGNTDGTWTSVTLDPGIGLNGLDVGDINGDARPDIAVGGVWMQNPGDINAANASSWVKHTFFTGWNDYAAVQIVNMDADPQPEIVMSVSEAVGGLSWFDPQTDVNGLWQEKNIATGLTNVHGVDISDIDADGIPDVVASEYEGQGRLIVYQHRPNHAPTDPEWISTVLGTDELHNLHAAYLNGDSALDFYGVYAWGVNPVIVYMSTNVGPDIQVPSVPTGLNATAISATQINLSWAASTDNVGVTGYRVFRNGVQVGTTTTTNYQDIGLSATTTYNYTVKAYDAAGNVSADSATASATTPTPDTTPPVISGISTSNVAGTSAKVNWTTNEIADTQVQYGLTTSYGGSTTLNTALVTAHTQTLSGLTPNTTYHYRVLSKDASGNLTTSGDGTFTTTAVAATPQFVQTAAITTGSTATASVSQAFTSANTAGNLIAVAVSWGANTGTPVCSDSQGNTYAMATYQFDSTLTQGLAICYASNIKAGANTVTVTFGGKSPYQRLIVSEYSGVSSVSPVDVTAQNIATATTGANDATSTSATTTANGDLIFGAIMDDQNPTSIAAGTGFTQRNSVNNKDLVTQDMVQTTAGSTASTATFGAAHHYLAQMVAFKAAP